MLFRSAYCPYNSNYVICCGKEYSYDACVYPLVNKGRCGNKYKCECDSSQYKYTDHECKTVKGHAGEGYQNSYASGASCMQTGYDSKSGKITTEIKYSSCQCDRGIYPKDPKNCDKNSERNGPCSTKYSNSSATELYYKYCECNTQDYPKTDASCYPLKGDATNETCFDTIMRYKSCASCDEFPARSLDHVAYSGNPANAVVGVDYTICPRDQSGSTYMKILRCNEPGYKVNHDGSACEPKSCKEAVMDFLKTNSSYALFDGNKLIDGEGRTVTSGRTAIIAGDMSIGSASCSSSTTTERRCNSCSCVNSSSGRLCQWYDSGACDSISCGGYTYKCCTSSSDVTTGTRTNHGGLKCLPAYTYYSARYLMERISSTSDVGKGLRVACQNVPTLTYTSSVFPYLSDNSSASPLNLYGINLKFTTDTTVKRSLNVYNANVNLGGRTVFFQGKTKFLRESSKANSENTKISNGNIKASIGSYYSDQYAYDVSALYFWNIPIEIKMNNDQEFKANTMCTLSQNNDFRGGKYFVKYAYIGANCHDGWIRGAVLRIRDGAKWYMYLIANNQTYSYQVQMRDGAHFCADPNSQILFKSGEVVMQGSNGNFVGCRIYHDKDRTLSNGNWDPSDYTSWSNRNGCGLW